MSDDDIIYFCKLVKKITKLDKKVKKLDSLYNDNGEHPGLELAKNKLSDKCQIFRSNFKDIVLGYKE